jgi:hypothetical protein
MSGKKILAIGFIFVLLVAIPLTVYLVQQQQKTKSSANQTTNLSLAADKQNPINPGDMVTLAVTLTPGTNQVSFVKLIIKYDPKKLTMDKGHGLQPIKWTGQNGVSEPQILEGPSDDGKGTMTMTISVQGNPADVISANQQIASVGFDTNQMTSNDTTTVTILKNLSPNQLTSQVLSINSSDRFNENVLSQAGQAIITTAGGGPAPTATLTPTATPTGGPAPTATPTGKPAPTATGAPATGPICTSLTVDPSAQGVAPYAVNFTVNGQDNSSTISSVTFNFGDGQTQNVTSSAALGTNSISVLQSHIYNDPGSFTATAALTDASSSVSPIGNCNVAITTNGTLVVAPTATPTVTVTSTPLQQEQSGPKDLVTIGSIGAIITVIGAILLLAL